MGDQETGRVLEDLKNEIRQLQGKVLALERKIADPVLELDGALRRRGLHPFRRNPAQHLFFPPHFAPKEREKFYELFKKYSFRLFLREILIRKGRFRVSEVVRFSTPETGRKYLGSLRDLDLAEPAGNSGYQLRHAFPASLGPTLEWFVAETLRNEFACPAVHGLRCRGSRYGGDYDVVALVEGRLVYIEVKSSPPKNIEGDEVEAFFGRLNDLLPHLALFFVDTELRLADKIVPFFETEVLARGFGGNGRLPSIRPIGDEIYLLPPGIYILSSKKSISRNIAACFRNHFALGLPSGGGQGLPEPL